MSTTRPPSTRTGAVLPPTAASTSVSPPPSRAATLRWLNRRLATTPRPGGGPPLPPVPSVEACRDGVAVAAVLHALSPAHLPAGAVTIPAATAAAREANWAAVADALQGLGVERVLEVDRLVSGGAPATAAGASSDGDDAPGTAAAAAAPTAADLSACLAAAVEAERRAAALAAELAEEVAARRVAAAQADHFGRRVEALRAVLATTGGEARAGRLFAAVAAAIGADDEGGVGANVDADAPVAVASFEPAANAPAASGAPAPVSS
ncbi:hypothetical protein MMPV_009651 [Pyropia vietnamensis]